MDVLKKKAAAAAGAAAPVAGSALIRAGSALEAAAPIAASTIDKASTLAAAGASAAQEKAMENSTVRELAEKHGDKAAAGMEFLKSSLARAFAPSPEMQAFIKNPSQEGLLANPDLIFQGLALLSAFRHPKAGIMRGILHEGMDRAAHSQVVEKSQEAVVHEGISRTLNQATQGAVTSVPPEVSRAATAFVKENPQQVMELMKLAAKLR